MKLSVAGLIEGVIGISIALIAFAALLPTFQTAADAVNDTGAPLASTLFGGSTPIIVLLLVVGVFLATYGIVKAMGGGAKR